MRYDKVCTSASPHDDTELSHGNPFIRYRFWHTVTYVLVRWVDGLRLVKAWVVGFISLHDVPAIMLVDIYRRVHTTCLTVSCQRGMFDIDRYR